MYRNLEECLIDLEKHGQLIRIKEEVDPNLEMASIHMRIHSMGGPAILFENVKNSKYRAVSNIFGTLERSNFIFRKTIKSVEKVISLRNDPMAALKKPFQNLNTGLAALKALPIKKTTNDFEEIQITDLPLIKHWPMDGGAFITLPQVYTEDLNKPGIMNSNLGMYRIQMDGNEYDVNKEVGLHYQIHRGIGIHQTIANHHKKPLKVSVFIGGPPAHTLAAVMPLPEGMSEITFAGLLAGRRFRYGYEDGFCISTDADFVITGEVFSHDNKPEGPFGDHLGYYSLTHPFPVMKVHKVYAKPKGIWAFTVVGRPPQEDTAFGQLIHEMTGDAIQQDIPGVRQVHAVDAAGVHPLLFAIGTERYTPFLDNQQPAEILTQSNRILGTGQLSLAKFLFITAEYDGVNLDINKKQEFLEYILKRIDWKRDIHFQTNTTIDTLDYSGTGLNSGSKVVFAAYGKEIRTLEDEVIPSFKDLEYFEHPKIVIPGIIALQTEAFQDYEKSKMEMDVLSSILLSTTDLDDLNKVAMIIVSDNSDFISQNINNFLWATFTKCNPSHDIYGINSFVEFKHWGCKGPLILDARTKPHHAPVLQFNQEVEKAVDKLFEKNGSLFHLK